MAEVVDETMMEAFAVVGEAADIGPTVLACYGDLVDRVSVVLPYHADGSLTAEVAGASRTIRAGKGFRVGVGWSQ